MSAKKSDKPNVPAEPPSPAAGTVVRMGDALFELGRQLGLHSFEPVRDRSPARFVDFSQEGFPLVYDEQPSDWISMKMYILVRDDVPLGFAMVAVAHASLAAYLKFRSAPEVEEWLDGPFYKVICKVNAKEFANAKEVPHHVVLTENALQSREVAIAFMPRAEWPEAFKSLKLYRDA